MGWLWLGIALMVGFGAGWVLSRNRSTAEMARFEGRLEELQGQLVRAQRANEALLAEAGSRPDRPPDTPIATDGDGHDEADDLTRIRGIGAVLRDKLHGLGITSYQQVAALTPEERARLDEALRLRGRIEREDWVGQARRLSAE